MEHIMDGMEHFYNLFLLKRWFSRQSKTIQCDFKNENFRFNLKNYLQQNSDVLNLGTGSVSWFEINGYGCKPTYSTNLTAEDQFTVVRPEKVDGCLLDYTIVEIIHASIQLILLVRRKKNRFLRCILKKKIVFCFRSWAYLLQA